MNSNRNGNEAEEEEEEEKNNQIVIPFSLINSKNLFKNGMMKSKLLWNQKRKQ